MPCAVYTVTTVLLLRKLCIYAHCFMHISFWCLQEMEVERELVKETGMSKVKDIVIHVGVLKRRAQLIFCPGFTLDYTFSESFSDRGEIIAERFLAMMGGTVHPEIRGERHYCPRKAQLAATGLGASVGLVTGTVSTATFGLEAILVDVMFWTFIAASAAGQLIDKFHLLTVKPNVQNTYVDKYSYEHLHIDQTSQTLYFHDAELDKLAILALEIDMQYILCVTA